MKLNKLITAACLGVLLLMPSSGQSVTPHGLAGEYLLYGAPYAKGEARIKDQGDKVAIHVLTMSTQSDATCEWQGEVEADTKLKLYYDQGGEVSAAIKLSDDYFEIAGARNICGAGASLNGVFVRQGTQVYHDLFNSASPLPLFDAALFGNITDFTVSGGKYSLTLDQVVETYTITGTTSDRVFSQIEETLLTEKIYVETLVPGKFTVAILMRSDTTVAVVPVFEEEIWIREVISGGSSITLDACINETDQCFQLRVSEGNPLAKSIDQGTAQKIYMMHFNRAGEVLGMQEFN